MLDRTNVGATLKTIDPEAKPMQPKYTNGAAAPAPITASGAPTNDAEAAGTLIRLALGLAQEPPGDNVPKKGRNCKLNEMACQLGHYGAAGRLDKETTRGLLHRACMTNGLIQEEGEAKFQATFESGWSEGVKEPRWPRASVEQEFGDEIAAAEVDRLARLGRIAYERERKEVAKKLGIRERVLDEAVAECRAALQQPGEQASWKRETVPWDTPVDGHTLVIELVDTIRRYLVLPRHGAETMALWVLHAHAVNAPHTPGNPPFQVSPYLTFTSPAPECGKTRALKIVHRLTPRPLLVSNTTGPVTFRLVEAHQPTLLLDEAETYTADDESLRGILDAAHDYESASIPRCVGDKHEVAVFRVWCPKAVGLIGKLPDTLMSRSIVIGMQRKKKGQRVERLLATDRTASALFDRLNRQCARWVQGNIEALREHRPDLPDELGDRDVDNWTPLTAVAEQLGGIWPVFARVAAVQLSDSRSGRDDGWRGVALLRDVRRVFDESGKAKLYAGELAIALSLLPDATWSGLDTRTLRAMLRGFLEHQRYVDARGSYYPRSALEDSWASYCPD